MASIRTLNWISQRTEASVRNRFSSSTILRGVKPAEGLSRKSQCRQDAGGPEAQRLLKPETDRDNNPGPSS